MSEQLPVARAENLPVIAEKLAGRSLRTINRILTFPDSPVGVLKFVAPSASLIDCLIYRDGVPAMGNIVVPPDQLLVWKCASLLPSELHDFRRVLLDRLMDLCIAFYADGSRFEEADFTALAGLTGLRFLSLSRTSLTDRLLELFAGLAKLDWLDLGGTPITDKGLGHVERLSRLARLGLSETKITDSGLRHVSALGRLESLYLRETSITDAGLKTLSGLAGLSYLDVRGTTVTRAGIDDLRRALPSLRVVHSVALP